MDELARGAFVEAANFALRFSAEAKRFYERKKARTNNVVATKAFASPGCKKTQPALDPATRRAADRLDGHYFNINRGIDARLVFAHLT